MSFALDYRRKLQEQERKEQAFRKANKGFVALPLEPDADTKGNGRRVLMALVIAGGLLAVLNSAGLVNYAYGLADSRLGRNLVVVSEHWHRMMEQGKATKVVDHIRGSVAMIREANWQDLRMVLMLAPGTPAEMNPARLQVIPVNAPGPAIEPERREENAPTEQAPKAPIMRAAADGLVNSGN